MTGVLMGVCAGALVWTLASLFVTLCDLSDWAWQIEFDRRGWVRGMKKKKWKELLDRVRRECEKGQALCPGDKISPRQLKEGLSIEPLKYAGKR